MPALFADLDFPELGQADYLQRAERERLFRRLSPAEIRAEGYRNGRAKKLLTQAQANAVMAYAPSLRSASINLFPRARRKDPHEVLFRA